MIKKRRVQKQPILLDLTAMVDLGFLLITFFMLQTMLTKPRAMELNMFEKNYDKNTIKCYDALKPSRTLSILLGENNKVYSYIDPEYPQVDTSDFSKEGIRAIILKRKEEVAVRSNYNMELVLLIRSMPNARYKNLIDIFDEMVITGVKHYSIVDIDCNDKAIMKATSATE